jgi:ParB-like chromosome segregation protein Spo0J
MAAPTVQHVPIGSIKPNPSNPRTIRDERFHKLVQSIKDFPEMLELRPIVTDADRVVLGGNMRLKACKAAGLKTVPVVVADHLTESQRREFIVKDNVGFGDWDWDVLANEWDAGELTAWGIDIPTEETAEFQPDAEQEQPRLDQKAMTICPSCGHEFAKP